MAQDLIPLAEAVAALRSELGTAMKAGKGETLRFQLGPIELELNLVVSREASAEGKLAFKIFGWGADASAGGKLADERTHRVKLTLTPVDEDGNPLKVLVSDRESPADRE